MSTDIKINGINYFINKFDTPGDIIDIDKLKTSFKLDNSEEGFYKLSLSQKKNIGGETVNDTYNRPPIGPIKNGLYCSYCDSIGPEDHKQNCDFPQNDSLYLTMAGFKNYIMSPSYSGDYSLIREKNNRRTLTQEDLNEILLIPDEMNVTDGVLIINSNEENVFTNISYDTEGIFKKRGPKKLASKTATTQFLNNIIISHLDGNEKTSIRISKNGLINLINIPESPEKFNKLKTELIKRVIEADVINSTNLEEITGETEYRIFDKFSYVHSMSGQLLLENFNTNNKQIDFENLDNLISPYDNNGELVSGPITNVVKTPTGENIINLNSIKIIEWEYSLGRLTRNQIMSKEYIKFVTTPAEGLKMTSIINKYGTITMTISRCGVKYINQGLCLPGNTDITKELFNGVYNEFNKLFLEQEEILTKKALDRPSKEIKSYNTVSGNAVLSSVCRNTQTRIDDDGNSWKEGKRPDPYSWKGKCPDPNYQYLNPEGVKGPDGLWYPCCKAKSDKSTELMKTYLLDGFPRNKEEAIKYDINLDQDNGSGILIPDSNTPGSSANIKINGVYEIVTVISKKNKKSNEYLVRRKNGETTIVVGENFKRDSRIFPGLRSFDRDQLISCVQKNLKKSGFVVNFEGILIKNTVSYFNEKNINENINIIKNLLDINIIESQQMTYHNLQKFKEIQYNVKSVPGDSVSFYLYLGPGGNFYFNNKLLSIYSDIQDYYDTEIILKGYLRKNEIENMNEFHIIDLIYYSESFADVPFGVRQNTIMELQNNLLNSIISEILTFPDFFNDIIDGSNYFINQDKNSILTFTNVNKCEYITWGEDDDTDDIIELQVLELTKGSIIKFGYEGKTFPKELSFLEKYEFIKREIPDKLFRNDYILVKINRDFNGKIVPKRKISIIEKTNKSSGYDEVVNKLFGKFNSIESSFFEDSEEWFINPENTLIRNGNILSDA